MKLIWAEDSQGGIGLNNTLPWHLPEDLRNFKELTASSPIIMGRKTFDSLPGILPGRPHHVLTSDPSTLPVQVRSHATLDDALCAVPDAWVIGGAALFTEVIPEAATVVRTIIHGDYQCDTFAPQIPSTLHMVSSTGIITSSTGIEYEIELWQKL